MQSSEASVNPSRSIAKWAALIVVVVYATTLMGTGEASASAASPPHEDFCTSVLNGAWLDNAIPSGLSEGNPLTVADAGAVLPYFEVLSRKLQTALGDFKEAQKTAPVASLARSWSKANTSYASEDSYVSSALSTLIKVVRTKNDKLIPAIATALNKASAAGFAANVPFTSDQGVQIRLCTPWATAMHSTQNVVFYLSNVSGDESGGLTTPRELQRVIKRHASSPKVAVDLTTSSAGDLKSARLSVATSKYRIYTCLSFYRSPPQYVVANICARQ